jgi:hypothetical protein
LIDTEHGQIKESRTRRRLMPGQIIDLYESEAKRRAYCVTQPNRVPSDAPTVRDAPGLPPLAKAPPPLRIQQGHAAKRHEPVDTKALAAVIARFGSIESARRAGNFGADYLNEVLRRGYCTGALPVAELARRLGALPSELALGDEPTQQQRATKVSLKNREAARQPFDKQRMALQIKNAGGIRAVEQLIQCRNGTLSEILSRGYCTPIYPLPRFAECLKVSESWLRGE